jgi:hypothetical protein
VLAGYEAAGAATFVVQLTGVPDDEMDPLAGSVRTISDVRSVEAPYSGLSSNIAVDTSFSGVSQRAAAGVSRRSDQRAGCRREL